MGSGYSFENELKHALQNVFPTAYVHRFIQSTGSNQDFDLVVIKKQDPFFIECKSRNVKGRKTWKLATLFSEGQLNRQLSIIDRTGLNGYLAFECRQGRGIDKKAVLLKLSNFDDQKINLDDFDLGFKIRREQATYQIPEILK